MCLHWLQLLIKPPSMQLASPEEHSLPHTVFLLLFFMFIGIRWFVERSTPRHAHPVRSAEKTTAATLLPLILGAAGSGSRQPWACPLRPACTPPPSRAAVPAPAQTVVYPHGAEHSAASRHTHGGGTAIPHPAVSTLPRAVCRCQSCAQSHSHRACQHSCSLLLGRRPPSPTTHVFSMDFANVRSYSWQRRTFGDQAGTHSALRPGLLIPYLAIV